MNCIKLSSIITLIHSTLIHKHGNSNLLRMIITSAY